MAGISFRYSTPLILPQNSDVDSDPIAERELNYLFNAFRTLATQLDTVTGELSPLIVDWADYVPAGFFAATKAHKIYAQCSADIAYGAMVNFHNVAGALRARPAVASGIITTAAGFCNQPGGFSAGQIGEFICGPGICTGISGMTPATWYYLDPATVSGQVTAVQPAAAGQVVQVIGQALSANQLLCGAFNGWRLL